MSEEQQRQDAVLRASQPLIAALLAARIILPDKGFQVILDGGPGLIPRAVDVKIPVARNRKGEFSEVKEK